MAAILGKLLKRFRAGEAGMVWQQPAAQAPASLRLSSPAFVEGGWMPRAHAGHGVGGNLSPALSWSGLPADTKGLVLVLEDPDVPLPRPFVHLIAWGIRPDAGGMPEGGLNGAGLVKLGRNTMGPPGYMGPRALRGHGPHRYVFQLYALDRELNFSSPPDRAALLQALHGAVLARGRLTGLFEQN